MKQAENIDKLTTSVKTWNNSALTAIGIRDGATNVLASYDYVSEPLMAGTVATPYCMLRCSDNQTLVGVPFNPKTYSVLNNDAFLSIIEQIGNALDGMGIKWSIATTGTLNNRGRVFVALVLDGQDKFNVDGREILTFLNALNSIDKSCAVTFANNTFCVCCKNTFAHVLSGSDSSPFHAAIRHSSGMKAALQDIPKLVEYYITGNQKLLKTLKKFAQFPVGLVDAEEIFAAFLGVDATGKPLEITSRTANQVERLQSLFVCGKGNKGVNALDLFSAATEYYTHESAGKSDDVNKQFASSEIGDGAKSKVAFYETLVKLVNSQQKTYQGFCKIGREILVAYRTKPAKV